MSEGEARAIAERWCCACFGSPADALWSALVAAHRRVVELEATLALMDVGPVPDGGYCKCDDCTAYRPHKASRPPDAAGPQ